MVKLLQHLRIRWHTQICACILTASLDASPCHGAAPATPANHRAERTVVRGDPWQRLNRKNYAVEGALDRHVIRPLSWVYRKLTPRPIGRGIHNIHVNLSEPVVFVNCLL